MIMAKKSYNPPEIEYILNCLVLLIDSRENTRTKSYQERIDAIGLSHERVALSYADYSCKSVDLDGNELDMRTRFAIERKMSLDELASCFTNGRERFKREFERANKDNCKIHLIIEDSSYEKLILGRYRSQLNPKSFIASLLSWSIRYGFQIHFCKKESSGQLIRQILYCEMREYLLSDRE